MKKPTVTQLLDLLAKPALINWANRQGLAGIDIQEQRRVAKANGNSLHHQVEAACKGTGFFEKEEDGAAFQCFMKDKQIVSVETKFETEWFTGRYDCKLKYKEMDFLVDYKSGYAGKLYLENKLQLVAYGMAEPVNGLAIVSIPSFDFVPVKILNRGKYEDMLICLSKIYNLQRDTGDIK